MFGHLCQLKHSPTFNHLTPQVMHVCGWHCAQPAFLYTCESECHRQMVVLSSSSSASLHTCCVWMCVCVKERERESDGCWPAAARSLCECILDVVCLWLCVCAEEDMHHNYLHPYVKAVCVCVCEMGEMTERMDGPCHNVCAPMLLPSHALTAETCVHASCCCRQRCRAKMCVPVGRWGEASLEWWGSVLGQWWRRAPAFICLNNEGTSG